jgi:antibiotic biosynthesis monooxygenase (ABM) superfamily enzyme
VWLAGPEIAHWPLALRTLLFTVVLVPWMVFLALPMLQRLLGSWLRRG